MKALELMAQLSYLNPLMGFAVVPNHDDISAQMAKQVAKEFADLDFGNVAIVETVIKAETISDGT